MTRSRRRKLIRIQAKAVKAAARTGLPLAALLAGIPAVAQGQQPPTESGGLQEVVVTAQKREENLQDVPVSITSLGNQKLEELHVADFEDYAKYVPSLTYDTFGPGFSRVFFRGVNSGDNGNHSGPLPTVGIYLDEQPITTIQGALDVHVYDLARIEALAGPQGTLYGGSSQAGTIRYITNKPDSGGFDAGYDLEGNIVDGEAGYVAEGFVNVPVGENAAIRLVGWGKRDAPYVDNVPGTITYETPGVPVSNAAVAQDKYNDVETYGARAALRVDLNDSWTVTPVLMGQSAKANGAFAYDPLLGDLAVTKFRPETSDDRWWQLAMTVEGRVSNLDLVYAGAYLDRKDDTQSDYADYTYFYDQLYSPYMYFNDDSGAPLVDPTQYIQGKDRYDRQTHEIRLSSAQDQRTRFVAGFFFQQQNHGIEQRYKIDDFNNAYEVTGWSDTIWLTEQERVDRDYALFGELSFDVTQKLTATGGLRAFRAKNSLEGFFGYGDGFSTNGRSGEALCSIGAGDTVGDESSWVPYTSVGTAPCKNLDRVVEEEDVTPKVNLTYRFTDQRMAYVTYSEGYRPGGVNRRGTFPPYKADFLKNYEIGWKTTLADNRLRFNGAIFWLDWNDFQYSFLGLNGLTNIVNAGGAKIRGVEADFDWAATDSFRLSGGVSVLDSQLDGDFCEKQVDDDGVPVTIDRCRTEFSTDFAADGTELPTVPQYKANLTGRYSFPVAAGRGFVQGSFVYQDDTRSALMPADEAVMGHNDAYGIADLSGGFGNDRFSVELFVNNVTDERADITRFTQCDPSVCTRTYVVTNQPRTYGIKFGQKF
jgi:iron complex outermembrane recepter protein